MKPRLTRISVSVDREQLEAVRNICRALTEAEGVFHPVAWAFRQAIGEWLDLQKTRFVASQLGEAGS